MITAKTIRLEDAAGNLATFATFAHEEGDAMPAVIQLPDETPGGPGRFFKPLGEWRPADGDDSAVLANYREDPEFVGSLGTEPVSVQVILDKNVPRHTP